MDELPDTKYSFSNGIHPKYADALTSMVWDDNMHYYGFYNTKIRFIPNDQISTAGVTIDGLALMHIYNPYFIDRLNMRELKFLILHETFHLLFNHIDRQNKHQYDRKLSNIAQDMIINEIIISTYPDSTKLIHGGITLTPTYDGPLVFEPLYHYLLEAMTVEEGSKTGADKKKLEQLKKTKAHIAPYLENQSNITIENQGKALTGVGQENRTKKNIFGDTHFDYDDEIISNLNDEIKNEFTSSRSLDNTTQHLFETVFSKKKKNNLVSVMRQISNYKGYYKKTTYKRPHRKGYEGMRGSKKVNLEINAILDISGSIDDKRYNVLISQLYHNGYTVNLIPVTTKVIIHVVTKSKKEIQTKYQRNHIGGTRLQPGIDYITDKKNGVSQFPIILLTDGYTDELDCRKTKSLLVISTDVKCPILFGKNKVKQIILK